MKHTYLWFTSLCLILPVFFSAAHSDDSDDDCPVTHDEDGDGHDDCLDQSFFGMLFGNRYRGCPDSHDKDNDGHCDCRENDQDYIMSQALCNDYMNYPSESSKNSRQKDKSKKKENSRYNLTDTSSSTEPDKHFQDDKLSSIRRQSSSI